MKANLSGKKSSQFPQSVFSRLLLTAVITSLLFGCEKIPDTGWMTYRNDNSLSAITDEPLSAPLSLDWVYRPAQEPDPAWYVPAEELPRSHFDSAYHVTVAGGKVYYGSSVDGKVYALDSKTGKEMWSYYTEGPVRTSPTFSNNRIYAGSDDGHVYCLNAGNGKLVWKYRAAPDDRRILGNEHMISRWPVRTSILIDDGVAYFGAGVFPHEGIAICALDVESGGVIWKNDTIGDRSHELMFGGISPQGYLLCSKDVLYVPSGRALPALFERKTGKFLQYLSPVPGWQPSHHGGTWALLNRDKLITTNDRNAVPAKVVYDADEGKLLQQDACAWYPGIDMVITQDASYIITEDELLSLDWKKLTGAETKVNANIAETATLRKSIAELKKATPANDDEIKRMTGQIEQMARENDFLKAGVFNWKVQKNGFAAIILAGGTVVCGGDGFVSAYDAVSGKETWSESVDGKAAGMAVHDGRLYVSADKGGIYCFREGASGAGAEVPQIVNRSPYPDNKESDEFIESAENILRETGQTRGWCLVLDSGEGQLAYELATRSELNVIGIERDEKKVTTAKQRISDAGLLGTRVRIEAWDISRLPDYFANLIVSGDLKSADMSSYPPDEVYRVLRPFGGVVCLWAPGKKTGFDPNKTAEWMRDAGLENPEIVSQNESWAKAERGALPGAGSWTHVYSNAENTACSDDELVKGSMEVLWFGGPGPLGMVDRHAEAVGPVAINGRLFVQGEETVSAYDSYNGTKLWERKIPGAVRVRAKIDGGNLAASEDALYVAAYDKCYRLDPATGETVREFSVPVPADGSLRRWGYIAVVDDVLYGSAAMPLTQQYAELWNEFSDNDAWKSRDDIPEEYLSTYDSYTARFPQPDEFAWKAFHRDGALWRTMANYRHGAIFTVKGAKSGNMMMGDGVFAMDTETGELLWNHKGKEIPHISISIGDGVMYFAENTITKSRRRKAIAERKTYTKTGIFEENDNWKEHLKDGLADADIDVRTIYALDAKTGVKRWSRDIDVTGCCGDKMGSAFHKGMLFFFGHFGDHDAWRFKGREYIWRRITAIDTKNGDMVWSKALNYRVKPLIVGDKIIIEPRACDYLTGNIVTRKHPITGMDVEWEFLRPGHCCSISSAAPSTLFYRSHVLGMCDIENDRGISLFGAIRPGCFTNVVPANGLVLFPESGSGCTCSFPVKCSVALKPRREKPEWTVFITHGDMTPVKHFAINFGAPGDMKDPGGTVWFAYPNPKTVYAGNHFPNYGVKFDLGDDVAADMGYFREDYRGKTFEGTDKPWLFTSGCIGMEKCAIPLIDDAKEAPGRYTVRIGFMSRPGDSSGDRVFDVSLQNETVLAGLNVVKESNGGRKPVIREFRNIDVTKDLLLELIPKNANANKDSAPVINFIEVTREGEIVAMK